MAKVPKPLGRPKGPPKREIKIYLNMAQMDELENLDDRYGDNPADKAKRILVNWIVARQERREDRKGQQ